MRPRPTTVVVHSRTSQPSCHGRYRPSYLRLLPHDAILARSVSVRLSVTRRYCCLRAAQRTDYANNATRQPRNSSFLTPKILPSYPLLSFLLAFVIGTRVLAAKTRVFFFSCVFRSDFGRFLPQLFYKRGSAHAEIVRHASRLDAVCRPSAKLHFVPHPLVFFGRIRDDGISLKQSRSALVCR